MIVQLKDESRKDENDDGIRIGGWYSAKPDSLAHKVAVERQYSSHTTDLASTAWSAAFSGEPLAMSPRQVTCF